MLGIRFGEERRALAAGRVEGRRLELDPVEVRLLARQAAARGDLAELAVAEREDGLRHDRDDLGIRKHRSQRVGLCEQVVPDDQGDVVVPPRVDGLDVPPYRGSIDDVVVHERRGMHELERLGEVDDHLAVGLLTEARGEEDECGAQQLAGGLEKVRDRIPEDRMRATTDVE